MSFLRIWIVLGFAGAALLAPERAAAQAYCALRDPVRAIYKFFPEADGYRSIVREVDEAARRAVGERLPFSLHQRELAQHTLYVATKGDAAIGVLHVRSERARWGLVEIAWAFDPSLRIRDFGFQRCRSAKRKEVEDDRFRAKFHGHDLATLLAWIDFETGEANERFDAPDGAETLASAVLRSGLKTLAVTEVVWGEDLAALGIAAPPQQPAAKGAP